VTHAVETRDLTKHYTMGQAVVRALDGISLDIARGEFLALLGTSGSGKSTLLNLIAGLDHPTSGSLSVFGHDLAAMSREALSHHRRKNVGMIFQSFNLIATMTALENVTLAMVFAEVPRRAREERGRALLEQVGLGGRHAHRPSELSGGEQQRVSIARALANNPDILLADEPTGNLDSRTAREIIALLQQLNAGVGSPDEPTPGRTVVLVTHDAALAASCARRTVTLLDGRVVEERAS
jgi:ABC-type lipoprotein export system ATPase subunit